MKLDEGKTRHAIGIAGVASAALRQSRVGELSHWKGVAFANAARHGVYSAMLARAGLRLVLHRAGRRKLKQAPTAASS